MDCPIRANPFEPIEPESLAAIYQWPDLALGFLAGEVQCLQVIGQCGMGKTALLRQIELHLGGQGIPVAYTYVVPDRRVRAHSVTVTQATLLDETDRLAARDMHEIMRLVVQEGARLVFGTHRNQSGIARRAGLPCATLSLKCLRDARRVGEVFSNRIAREAGSADHPFFLAPGTAEALLRCSRGNIARILQLGYEIFEDIENPRPITPDDVEGAAYSLRHTHRNELR